MNKVIDLKKLLLSILNIIIYIFISDLLILGISIIIKKIPFLNIFLFKNILLLIPSLIILGTLIWLNKGLFKDKYNKFKKDFNKNKNFIFSNYIAGLIAMMVLNNIIAIFTQNMAVNEELNRQALKVLPIYSLVTVVFTGPICEEIAFRGSFKAAIKNKYVYYILTSFLFGFIHVVFNGDFIYTLPYGALGFFLARIYYETDNIYNSIFIHAMHNTLCVLTILFL